MNAWKLVFLQSRVNNGYYDEDQLPQFKWDWPKETWFQSRLYHVRDHEPVLSLKSSRKMADGDEMRAM